MARRWKHEKSEGKRKKVGARNQGLFLEAGRRDGETKRRGENGQEKAGGMIQENANKTKIKV